MARRILLVDPDVDHLAELSGRIRSRGFTVHLADSAWGGMVQLREKNIDAILVVATVCGPQGLPEQLKVDPKLQDLPCLILIRPHDIPEPSWLTCEPLDRDDLERILSRLVALPPRSVPQVGVQGDFRGDLAQVPLIDLLQLLSMNRKTGALTVTTATGVGEVRLVEGEVIDAVYRRLEGVKALYRLLAETDGAFAFVPGGESALRRITLPTSMLVLEAMRQLDEMQRRRAELVPAGEALTLVEGAPAFEGALHRQIAQLLQAPRALDELLDDLLAPDLRILEVLTEFAQQNLLRRIPRSSLVTRLASEDKLPVLRALVQRLCRNGFDGAPRLAIAASSTRLAMLTTSLARIEDALLAPEPPPNVPLPHPLGTVRLGDGVELSIVAWPLDARFVPLWGLALPGTAAVVTLEDDVGGDLESMCSAAEVPLLYASDLLGDIEGGDPAQLAALLRITLETVAAS